MPRKQNSQIAWGAASESKGVIIDAAVRCFKQYGPQRTSMDDIAEAAGISRKTLYRVFDGRPELVQAVLQHRWAVSSKKVKQRVAKADSFEEALLEGSVTAVSTLLNDKLAIDIIQNATDHTLEQFMLHGNQQVHKTSADVWLKAVTKGRKAGAVKEHLSDDQVMEIIRSLLTLLVMRDDEPSKQRQFLKDVLLPAIMVSQSET